MHISYLKSREDGGSICRRKRVINLVASVVNHQNDVAADKRAKWENRFNTINSIAGGLQTLGTSMNSSSSYSDAVRPSPSPASVSGNYQTQYNEWARKQKRITIL